MLFFLLACTPGADSGTGDTSLGAGRCLSGPAIAITSPESSATLPLGEPVSLVAEASSEVDSVDQLRVLWAVVPNGGNDDNVGTGLTQSWTPDAPGIWSIIVQVEDSCTDDAQYDLDPVQDDVRVSVE
ncbi:MAG: hypothetical protein FJ090_12790 [Deltaproteobacteria bacterium]|nr:hypothetical protein [Deltaproteobacteria bacterium]